MRWFLDHAVVDALLDDPQSPLERDAAIFDLKMLLMATALFHVHRAWRTTPWNGVGGWLGAYTTVVAGEGSRLAGDVATPGSGAYYRQILAGSVAAWFGCYLLLYLIVRFVERGSIDSAHTGWTGWHLKPTKTVLLLRLKSRRRSALPGAAAFRVTTNLPRDSDVFTVDITPVGHGPWPLRLWPFRYGLNWLNRILAVWWSGGVVVTPPAGRVASTYLRHDRGEAEEALATLQAGGEPEGKTCRFSVSGNDLCQLHCSVGLFFDMRGVFYEEKFQRLVRAFVKKYLLATVGDAEEIAAPRSSSSESLGGSSGDDDGEGKNGNGVRRNKDARKY